MSGRILYVAFDHLNVTRGVLKQADKARDHVVLVQSARMLEGRPWHPERLFFLVASARQFAAELEADGFDVRYIKAPTTIDGLRQAQSDLPELRLRAQHVLGGLDRGEI